MITKFPDKIQIDGVSKMFSLKNCLLNDDMGIGKTGQAILSVQKANAYPCLIICPSGLKHNWLNEIEEWTNEKGLILNDSCKNTFPMFYKANVAKFFIVNFESLSKFFVLDKPKRKDVRLSDITFNSYKDFFKSVIIDEIHNLVDVKAMQSKLTYGICKGKEYIFGLTGTLILNKPTDLASQLCIVNRMHHFGGYDAFMKKYKKCTHSELVELKEKLQNTCVIRREKKGNIDLPPMTRQLIKIEISNRDVYDKALKELASYLKEYKNKTDKEIRRSMRAEAIVKLNSLREIIGLGKVEAIKENINSLISCGEKVVVFGINKSVLNEFKNIKGSVSITGQDNAEQKQNSVVRFQNDPNTMLIVCSIKSASTGQTLTASRIIAHAQVWWNNAVQDQVEARIWRRTQTRECHNLYYFAVNTIDEKIYNLVESKRDMSNAISGSENDIEWQIEDDILNLIMQENE